MTKQYSGYTIGNDIKLYYVILDDGFDIYVTPIKAITKLLDYAIMVENNQK